MLRTAVVAMSDGVGVCVGGGEEFQLCPQGVPPGAGSVSQNFPKTLAGSISTMRYVIAFKFS